MCHGAGNRGWVFEAEHADGPDLEPLIGFSPTSAVDVVAGCNRPVDHLATALLTAAVMDVVGGVAHAELLDGRLKPWPAFRACSQ
ncbi:DUF6368 family protein [Streptomyces sp. NPDC090445]|uniref:DUF6368 family protein n=1 Tax=Streptomyces sp. NPDC090445 TaxID=3365963 RepID=UPI003801B2E0